MTATGAAQVISRFKDKVVHRHAPYDLPWVLKRFFKTYQAKIGLIMETELWPNLIYGARASGMPLLLVNARLSDQSFVQYKKLKFFFTPVLNQFNAILAQSEEDKARFEALGAGNVEMLGNIKFDLQMAVSEKSFALDLKNRSGATRLIVIAASTHQDEEEQILRVGPHFKK